MNELGELLKVRLRIVSAGWRDGNACTTSILRLFLTGAYTGKGFATFGRAWGGRVFLGKLKTAIGSRLDMAACTRTKTKVVCETKKGGLSEAWKR
jgi:hypothetical protein